MVYICQQTCLNLKFTFSHKYDARRLTCFAVRLLRKDADANAAATPAPALHMELLLPVTSDGFDDALPSRCFTASETSACHDVVCEA